ncbi:hypothetical protein CBE37_01605 [bacterium TMED277]|nr:MAG: hypothetical protein CBE37_01605 [bacterium TMED277]PQM63589.1 MAG: hypothetical protein CML38_08830 [Paracoccaceae bacterium]
MQINLLMKTFVVAFFLLGLSIKSAASAGGSDEEVFPPKTLEKLKKTYSNEKKAENNKKSNNGKKKDTKAVTENKSSGSSNADNSSSTSSSGGESSKKETGSESPEVLEDEPLIADLTTIIDKDGIGEVNVVWKISSDGNAYRTIPGATNQSFTPRQEHVGKTLKVSLTYLDGQGNLETLISSATTPVVNVNDKPTGVVRLTGESAEDSAFILDVSDIYDEDGMGPFNFTWQRTSPNSGWENYSEDDTEVLNLRQEHVSYTYRVRVEYIDGFNNREVVYSNESEAVRNVDDPVLGDVVILGEEKEGFTLEARTASLSDDDGIASIGVAWERSRDGRNWVSLTGENTKRLSLDQTVVGSQVRVKATLVDKFGIETVLHSQPTRIIENVNNVPVGNVLIRRVSN